MMSRFLTALPVFNECDHVAGVLDQVLRHTPDVLVVDDGSTDGTSELLADRMAARGDITVIHHKTNRGYGAALATAFAATLTPWSDGGHWDGLVTIDCDGQHQPQLIPHFITAVGDPADPPADIVSGSRYLKAFPGDSQPPVGRRRINMTITAEINQRFGLTLTDAFCGFKAYSRRALASLTVTETGYAMPLEVWVLAARAGLSIVEMPVPLVYLDLTRSFGGALDDGTARLAHYREVIERATREACSGAGPAGDLGYGVGSLPTKADA